MKKAILFSLLGILLLFGAGLVAGLHVFAPWERLLQDQPGTPPPRQGEMTWNTYKKIKLALGSLDLVNGLTKSDLETMNADNSLGFYYLVACLWLVVALRFGFRRPRKE
jgi:hypothetical protein